MKCTLLNVTNHFSDNFATAQLAHPRCNELHPKVGTNWPRSAMTPTERADCSTGLEFCMIGNAILKISIYSSVQ